MIYYTYYSYEPWGRGYIGAKPSGCPGNPMEDNYYGTFSDKTFRPTEKIILGEYQSPEECIEAEVSLHSFFNVDINPHFANRAKQTSTKFFFDSTGKTNKGSSEKRTKENIENNPMKNPEVVQKMLDSRKKEDNTWYENYVKSRRTPESREKSRVAAKIQWTEEAKSEFSEQRKGDGNPCFGKKWWVNKSGETLYQENSPGDGWKNGRVHR